MGVGQRLREIRLRKRVGLRELAKRLTISPVTLSQYERGESRIDADDLPRIAEALGVSPRDFFEEKAETAGPALERVAQLAAEIAVAKSEQRLRELVREAAWAGAPEERRAPRPEAPPAEPGPEPAMPDEWESDILTELGIEPDDLRWSQAMRVIDRLDRAMHGLTPFEEDLLQRLLEARRRAREEGWRVSPERPAGEQE
jgi:transcriptional regulator with XRE-family HTH domain